MGPRHDDSFDLLGLDFSAAVPKTEVEAKPKTTIFGHDVFPLCLLVGSLLFDVFFCLEYVYIYIYSIYIIGTFFPIPLMCLLPISSY